jgi:hypothetical protein
MFVYFNDYFRVRTYYETPAYIKNGIAKEKSQRQKR